MMAFDENHTLGEAPPLVAHVVLHWGQSVSHSIIWPGPRRQSQISQKRVGRLDHWAGFRFRSQRKKRNSRNQRTEKISLINPLLRYSNGYPYERICVQSNFLKNTDLMLPFEIVQEPWLQANESRRTILVSAHLLRRELQVEFRCRW